MGRTKNNNKNPIPNKIRVRMFRERQKLKLMRQQQLANQQSDNIRSLDPDKSIESNSTENSISDSSLKTKLADWVSEFDISKTAVDKLLSILKPHMNFLPKNSRTLLKTPLNVEIKENAGGEMWYYGLSKCIKEIFHTLDRDIDISLNFNMDGLNVVNSAKVCFWPILANIYGENI